MTSRPEPAREAAARLIGEYRMDPDRARRAIDIARDCELNNEPVTGGYVTITTGRDRHGTQEFTITPHTGQEKTT